MIPFYFFLCLLLLSIYLYSFEIIYLLLFVIVIFIVKKRFSFKIFFIFAIFSVTFKLFKIELYRFNEHHKISNIYKVVERKDKYIIVKNESNLYLLYDQTDLGIKDEIICECEPKIIDDRKNDFYKYLKKRKINFIIDCQEYILYKDNFHIFDLFEKTIFNGRDFKVISYLKLIVFNQKDDYSLSVFNSFSLLSCTHLICISGFHISFLLGIFDKIFKSKKLKFISYAFVFLYINILNFAVSAYRALLYQISKKLNDRFSFDISNVNLLSCVGIVFIIINPSVCFSNSFIYSFLFTFFIEFLKYKKTFKNKINFYFNIYLIAIPIMLINTYQINIFSFFILLIMIYPTYIIFAFSFLTLFLVKFDYIYIIFVNFIENILRFFVDKSIFLTMGKPSIYFLVIYYSILILYFISQEKMEKYRKLIYLFTLFTVILFQYCKPIFDYRERITFLDVGQGDCIIFFIPNSKEVVLLDTGGSKYYDIAKSKIIPYLKSYGINKIRKVIITHDDFDHNGALDSLKNNFIVGEILTSHKEYFRIGERKFLNLNDGGIGDNDSSIVLYGSYCGLKMIFMGDAGFIVEENILIENRDLDVDLIKIGHHGSKNSSSYNFLKQVSPGIAVISVGENLYGHPSKEVINNLKKLSVKTFRTDIDGNIELYEDIFFDFYIKYSN